MYTMHIYRSIASVRKSWKKLECNSNSWMSAYQSYWVNSVVKRRLPIYEFQKKYSGRYLEVRENGQPVLIMPLCQYRSSERYCSLGNFNGFQIYDLIYDRQMTTEKMRSCMSYIIETLKPGELELYNLSPSGILYQCIREEMRLHPSYAVSCSENGNVTICVENGYDQWYNALSKSTRQNVRTAYNRMKSDEIEMRFEVYRGKKLPGKLMDGLIDLYCSRHASRYDVQTSKLKKLYLRYLDFSTACLRAYRDNYCSVVYMNGEIAAFLSGLVEKNGHSIVVPRLSINNQFSRYSPGVVLINETIKGFSQESGLTELDLSKGVEGYKLSMGGTLYHTYNVVISNKAECGEK